MLFGEQFGNDIGELILCREEGDIDLLRVDLFLDKVKINLYVFCLSMKNYICNEISCLNIITPQIESCCEWDLKFLR